VASPELVTRLHPDASLARRASFALFVLTHLEEAGLAPRRLTGDTRGPLPPLAVEALPDAVAGVQRRNAHLLASFTADAERRRLAEVDPVAARDLVGWVRAQRLEREEPQVAYELGLLAAGTELPPVTVRSLRQLALDPRSRVAELPDGSGYPTVFLSSLRPDWDAAHGARLFVTSTDARQLAAWAMLLLTRRIELAGEAITVVDGGSPLPLSGETFDAALVYNPAAWLGPAERWPEVVRARAVAVV
jgi:hypothetical protein